MVCWAFLVFRFVGVNQQLENLSPSWGAIKCEPDSGSTHFLTKKPEKTDKKHLTIRIKWALVKYFRNERFAVDAGFWVPRIFCVFCCDRSVTNAQIL